MMMSLLLLAVLFIAGLINGFFYTSPKLFFRWLRSFLQKSTSVVSNTTSVAPKEKKRKKDTQYKAELKRVFATFDKNGDGFITKQELGESLNSIGFTSSEQDVLAMVERLDSNGDGLIDLDEFCDLYESTQSRKQGEEEAEEKDGDGEGDLKEAFEVFDGNGDGLISVDELGMVLKSLGLKKGMRLEDCKEMIRKVDMDGDGMVNFEEFKQMMKAGGRLVSIF